jgi:hypothetical protein
MLYREIREVAYSLESMLNRPERRERGTAESKLTVIDYA